MERPDYGDYGNSEEMPVNFMADPRLAPEVVFMNVAPSNLETLMELDMRRWPNAWMVINMGRVLDHQNGLNHKILNSSAGQSALLRKVALRVAHFQVVAWQRWLLTTKTIFSEKPGFFKHFLTFPPCVKLGTPFVKWWQDGLTVGIQVIQRAFQRKAVQITLDEEYESDISWP